MIGKYCKTDVPAPFVSNGNELYITFKSDMSTKKRFVLKYTTGKVYLLFKMCFNKILFLMFRMHHEIY